MTYPSAVILGLEGESLNDWERGFFQDLNPYGFILFKRNCANPEQIKRLTDELRFVAGRADAPILIDQEGGRVARLGPPHFPVFPPMQTFSDMAAQDMEKARTALRGNVINLCKTVLSVGVNVNCVPVLDVLDPAGHNIIGDRAFGDDPELVAALGRVVVETCIAEGVLPIIKHIPGHGRATVDSHEDLPVVNASRAELEARDFIPFRRLNDAPWAMLAHVIYTALDRENPASISPALIAMIRKDFGFNGVLIADDLSMKALTGSFESRARRTLEAGADLALHCNGDREEMLDLAKGLRPISETSRERIQNNKIHAAKAA